MGYIFSLSNHKGGVGKTTSTLNIGAGLRNLENKVLLVDLDPQSNLTQSMGITDYQNSSYTLLTKRSNIEESIIQHSDNLFLIPSELNLSGMEIEIGSVPEKEFILKNSLDSVKKEFDYIIIDCPPALGVLTINALVASDRIFLPIQSEYLAVQGMSKISDVIEKVKERLNPSLDIGGVFLTQFDQRRVLNRSVLEAVKGHFGDKLFNTIIRDNVALAEAPVSGRNIYEYAPKSYGADDYRSLCKEIAEKYS